MRAAIGGTFQHTCAQALARHLQESEGTDPAHLNTSAVVLQTVFQAFFDSAVVAALINQNNPQADIQVRELQGAARTLGLQVEVFKASSPSEIDIAFASLAQRAGFQIQKVWMDDLRLFSVQYLVAK